MAYYGNGDEKMLMANLVDTVMVYSPCNKFSQPIDHYRYGFHLQCNHDQMTVQGLLKIMFLFCLAMETQMYPTFI